MRLLSVYIVLLYSVIVNKEQITCFAKNQEKGAYFVLDRTNDFGKAVKIRLIEMNKTQAWLIEQVKERTGDFFDSSYLYRILSGKLPAEHGRDGKPGKAEVIRDILGMSKGD